MTVTKESRASRKVLGELNATIKKKFDKESQKPFIGLVLNTLTANMIYNFYELRIHKKNLTDSLSINTNALKIDLKISAIIEIFRAKPRENPHRRKTQRKNFIYER